MGAVKQSTIKDSKAKAKPLPKAPEAALTAKTVPAPSEARRGAKGAVAPKAAKEVVAKVVPAMKLSIALDATAAKIETFIKSIQNRGAKLDVDMHSAACASLNHAALHNDPTLLNRLVVAMPKAARKNAVILWAMKHGNVALNDEKSTKAVRPLVYMKGKPANIAAAVAEPFWELKNVKEGGSEWLYDDFIGRVMKTLQRVAMDEKSPEHGKAKAALEALNTVNAAMNVGAAAKVAPVLPTEAVVEPVEHQRRESDKVH